MQPPFALGFLSSLALFTVGATAPLSAQATIDGLSATQATLGTRFDILGDGFGSKPKLFLAQGGVKVKKTRLKLVALSDGSAESQTLTVEVRRALLGSFQVGVQPKGGEAVFSAATLEIVPPTILSVTPSSASPGDTVTVRVQNAGSAKLRGTIFKRAKVLGTTPVLAEGGASGFLDVQLRVPQAPNGLHNVWLANKLGGDLAKSALTVTDSSACPGKSRAEVRIDGALFKTKKVTVTEVAAGLLISASRGGANSRTLDVRLPFDPETDQAPQTYTLDPASLTYVETTSGTESGRWMSQSGDGFKIVVNSFQCQTLVLTVCGPLTPTVVEGGTPLPLEGMIVARLPKKKTGPPQSCNEMFGQVGGVPFLANTVIASYLPDFTTLLLGGLDTPLNANFSVNIVYDAFTQSAATFDTFGPNGIQLFKYEDNNENFLAFALVPGQLGSSVTLEILDNDGSCITGLFSGSVKQPTTGEVRTFNTFHFKAPLQILN